MVTPAARENARRWGTHLLGAGLLPTNCGASIDKFGFLRWDEANVPAYLHEQSSISLYVDDSATGDDASVVGAYRT
jgi:hypothetical protein